MQKSKTKKPQSLHKTKGDKIFLAIDWSLLTAFLIILVYPLLYIIMSSFSAGSVYMNLSLIPSKYSLEGYRAVFEHSNVWIGYRNSIVYTISFTFISLFVTICCAYPLSRRDFAGNKYIMGLCVFTMYFNGGLIPTFIWIRQMGMIDTVWALLLPGSLSVYNMIVMRTYFSMTIPEELREAAMLDGCSDIRFLIRIVLPLSGAIIAVMSMYYAVSMWNDYFIPMVYITSRSKLPLPNFLREILMINVQHSLSNLNVEDLANLERLEQRAELMKYSLIVVSSLPVMMIYPFVQKHFIKGVMIGAVKG